MIAQAAFGNWQGSKAASNPLGESLLGEAFTTLQKITELNISGFNLELIDFKIRTLKAAEKLAPNVLTTMIKEFVLEIGQCYLLILDAHALTEVQSFAHALTEAHQLAHSCLTAAFTNAGF
jgi:hypothetical protein